jgi:uncharacterized protein (TIGR00255 family)
MKSMTGFGRGTAHRDGWDVTVQTSSVNRKTLEIALSLPREWQLLEPQLAAVVRERFARGRIQIAVDLRSARNVGLQWDEAAVDAVLDRLARTAQRRGVACEVTPQLVFEIAAAHPIASPTLTTDDALDLIRSALLPALDELVATRDREGAALALDLSARSRLLSDTVAEIAARSSTTVANHRENLLARLRTAGLEIDLADERVLKEVALFAERIDIAEELTRLRSHLEHLDTLLAAEEPIGRKAEFVLQEIGREIHTIGSKANDIEVARRVIVFKNELERIREQIQNVE